MRNDQAPFMTTEFGLVYTGFDPMDDEDLELLDVFLSSGGIDIKDVTIDKLSICGRLDRDYSAQIWEQGTTTTKKFGGEGSHTYETQRVIGRNYGSGDVEFKPEDQPEIWHRDPDGNKVHGVVDYPRTGRSFHVNDYGENAAGPKPGTRAERRLGRGQYKWNKKNAWWVIRK